MGEITDQPTQPTPEESSRRRVEVAIPEELRRELVGERFFSTMETSIQRTIGAEREQGFVGGIRLKNLVATEVAMSEIMQGEAEEVEGKIEHSIELSLAQLELESELDVVSLLTLHTHPPNGPIRLSGDDIDNWKDAQKRPAPSIQDPEDNLLMRATNVRPVTMMLAPNLEDAKQSILIVLAQTEKVKLEEALELAFDIVAGLSIDQEGELANEIKSRLAKIGFRIGHFTLSQKEEIQQFLLEHLPEKLILEDAGIPGFEGDFSAPPRGKPDLSFLEK